MIARVYFQIYSYDFELMNSPLRTYQLVDKSTGSLLMDRMLFVISHNDEADPCSVSRMVCVYNYVCEHVHVHIHWEVAGQGQDLEFSKGRVLFIVVVSWPYPTITTFYCFLGQGGGGGGVLPSFDRKNPPPPPPPDPPVQGVYIFAFHQTEMGW